MLSNAPMTAPSSTATHGDLSGDIYRRYRRSMSVDVWWLVEERRRLPEDVHLAAVGGVDFVSALQTRFNGVAVVIDDGGEHAS